MLLPTVLTVIHMDSEVTIGFTVGQQLPGVDFHAVQGVAESLPFPAAQFDAVVGSLVMCSLEYSKCKGFL